MLSKYKSYYVLFGILVLTVVLILNYRNQQKPHEQTVIENVKAKRNEEVQVLEDSLKPISKEAQSIAEELSAMALNRSKVEQFIRQQINSKDFCLGITLAFEPGILGSTTSPLYAPYFSRKTEEFAYIVEAYDYTDSNSETESGTPALPVNKYRFGGILILPKRQEN